MSNDEQRESLLSGLDRRGEDGNPHGKRSDFWNPTLNIRFVEGHCMAFCYAHIQWMNFDPSIGIILHFSTHTVKLFGRNLRALYDELLELRRREVVVVSIEHDLGEANTPTVHRVSVEQVGESVRRRGDGE